MIFLYNQIKTVMAFNSLRDLAKISDNTFGQLYCNTGFPRYSRGLRSLEIFIREYQNPCFKPKKS
jgi:hypothetical protein